MICNLLLLTSMLLYVQAKANDFGYLATPIHSFKFKDSHITDEVGDATLLSGHKSEIKHSKYTFDSNGGPTLLVQSLSLANLGEYSVELTISLDNALVDGDGIIKLLDFKDLGSDYGAYFMQGHLGYVNDQGHAPKKTMSEDTIIDDRSHHVVITRRYDTKRVAFYFDGVQVLSLSDENNDFVLNPNVLRIFQDDNDEFCLLVGKKPQCDSGSGSIEYIKIYNESLKRDDVALLFVQGENSPTVQVCQCVSDGDCVNKPLSATHLLDICIYSNRKDFHIDEIDSLEYNYNSTIDVAVQDGQARTTSFVLKDSKFLMISTQLPEAFFYGSETEDHFFVTGKGRIFLASQKVPYTKIPQDFEVTFVDALEQDEDIWAPLYSDSIQSVAPSAAPSQHNAMEPPTKGSKKGSLPKGLVGNIVVTIFVLMGLSLAAVVVRRCWVCCGRCCRASSTLLVRP